MKQNIKVRELKYADIEPMWRLCNSLRRSLSDVIDMGLEEFSALWRHRWERNGLSSVKVPLGWCVEHSEKGIVSFVGTIAQDWWIGGKEIVGWGITSWISDPEFGARSVKMFMEVLNRTEAPIILECTANPVTAKVCKHSGLKEAPDDVSSDIFSWIFNSPKFSTAWSKHYLKRDASADDTGIKHKILKFLARSGMIILSAYLYDICRYFFKWSLSNGAVGSEYSISAVREFGPEFEDLWNRNKGKFFSTAVRTAKILNWRHFEHPPSKGKTYGFRCDKSGILGGYITFKFLGERESYCKNVVVTDLFYDLDDFEIAKALLISSYKFAKEKNAVRFQINGFYRKIMDWLATQKPIITRIPRCTYWYKYNVAGDKKGVVNGLWYASGIDGDLNL